ncbi:MAG: replicative DNA helicase [Clostridia bacterium]|nr:replicative DNA helicase [Clostridia bacterium]MBQ6837440.1 replicative DNA helicase [Clostridia bacterium]
MAKNENLSLDSITMPYSLETEQAVIGSILINPECVTVVLSQVKPDYFYIPQHREIMEAVMILDTLGSRIDALTILDKLNSSGNSDAEANKNYLFQIAQSVPSAANVENYCKIVREKYFLRSLITISRETIDSATEGGADADKLLDSAEQKIYDIRKGKSTGSLQRLIDVISAEVYPNLVQISSENAEEFKGIPTGFSKLDEITSGLNRSDLILIGARPAMGKTSFALNIGRNVGMTGKKVVFFSLEMSNEQLAARVLSTEARVESNKLRSGEISPDEWMRLAEATDRLTKCNLYFDDTSTITVPEIKSKIKRAKDVDCIIIDYLGLMESAKKKENRVQEVTEITRSLKMLAKDLKIPVVVCCQLSRGPEKNGKSSNRPMLSDLRDSGSIEQDADIVMMLYREGYYKGSAQNPDEIDLTQADVDVAKNRHGPTERIKLHWDAQYTLFSTLEYRDE